MLSSKGNPTSLQHRRHEVVTQCMGRQEAHPTTAQWRGAENLPNRGRKVVVGKTGVLG